jgi:DNA-directed RNA polymerase specialized sigma24 family protein
MKNRDKKYFIPVNGTLVEVSEEVYRAYYRPVWVTRYHAQKTGECRCSKRQLWLCDGICSGCPFHTSKTNISFETPVADGDEDITIEDALQDDSPSPESILMDKELLDTLYDELNRLDPEGRRICELIMQGKTEREIAAETGKCQSTVNYRKNKVFAVLRRALKDFI